MCFKYLPEITVDVVHYPVEPALGFVQLFQSDVGHLGSIL
jgi:hypothetical protein